jgi:hypothetical protein
MNKPSESDIELYHTSPEVHAAVNHIADLALRELTPDEWMDELVFFFGQYDRMRTNEVEGLKARVAQLLQQSSVTCALEQS